MRRWLGVAAVVAVAVAGLVVAASSGDDPQSAAERTQKLSARLRCPVCEGLSVADSSSSTARAIRDDVGRRVRSGEEDDEILQAYVDRYGEWILLTPESGGLGSLVWMLPIAALLAGAGLLGVAFWRWRSAPVPADAEFVERSLDDLEQEREEGNLDDEVYARLRGEYESPPDEVAPPRRRRGVVVAVVVGFAVLAAVLMGQSLGERLPGQSATGNDSPRAVRLADLAAAVDADPSDLQARMDYAGALLQEGRAADALQQYDAASELAPEDAEARAYGGWIVFLAGLADEARDRLDQAAAADPSFPDTYFFRGVVRLRQKDREGAAGDLRRYLRLAPEGAYEEQARVALREARATHKQGR